MRIRFGECLFDSETRQLLVRGRTVHLQPKAFQLLELLLEKRPAAVDKEAIHDRLWPKTFVSDGTVTSLVAEVRDAIGDDGREPRFIRTVHRFGYAFSGDGKELRGEARPPGRFAVWLVQARRSVPIDAGETIVGRDPGSPVYIDDPSVSRRHARLFVAAENVTVEDLESKNGTFVGSTRVERAVPLADGDVLRVGSVPLTVRIFELPESTETGAEVG